MQRLFTETGIGFMPYSAEKLLNKTENGKTKAVKVRIRFIQQIV